MNREDLEYDISVALDNWDEKSLFTLAGVSGLTRADLDSLLVCCDYHDQHGTLYPLRYFSKAVTEVLTRYGMLDFIGRF